ncbi:Hypothetical protein CAP_5623 [Chondromyces apiculatus DSM 436]|uniref:Blue (type 1) copper domain-containing protein n=1 Tax=Chondromyces apiculatus DSM 436 TaxID=1192034 RepID=A0A017T3L3_9BACT|nr:Hypothetical protein CAP_5623 [Chondromyces apiculatus DSM 436]
MGDGGAGGGTGGMGGMGDGGAGGGTGGAGGSGGGTPGDDGDACTANADCMSGMCYGDVCVASLNGCDIDTATDMTQMSGATITQTGQTYNPKCQKVTVGTVLSVTANFVSHPFTAGTIEGGVRMPSTEGPFDPPTNTGGAGTTVTFTMSEQGTFPYYCNVHGPGGMNGVVFVVPDAP